MRKANHQLAINHLKKSDPVMAAIIESVGPFRMQFGEPTFHALAEAILYQQLNGKAAVTIFNRFTALAGDPLTPKGILKLTDAEMRGVGLSAGLRATRPLGPFLWTEWHATQLTWFLA